MREHGALRRRKEIVREKSNGLDGGVGGKVMAHGQGYGDNLNPSHVLIRTEQGGTTQSLRRRVTSSGESGSRGCEGGVTLFLRSGVCRTPLAVEGATGTCNSVGCTVTDMGGYDMFFVWALARIEGAGESDC
jgi:hypothetical protein